MSRYTSVTSAEARAPAAMIAAASTRPASRLNEPKIAAITSDESRTQVAVSNLRCPMTAP